ncbi:hypothetical protein C4585_01270 [Candidatus Parcubacteria bacterium]|nr:MAG: hypothetical protein C4585_01270 [Candidatus Parcubacteria bacterium]
MRKLVVITVALFLVPVVSNAQTAEELRAQAQVLLQKIQQLQLQLGTTGTVNPGTGIVVDSSSCPQIGRVLGVGSSGDDVTRLQQFLARDPSIYPERNISGYYGPLTEAAVKRWQARFNIVSSGTPATTGYGQVGPRTAAAMSLQCSTYGGGVGTGGGGTVGGFIRVTPISGNAPLTVSVEATVNTVNACTPATYTIEYGDGTAPASIVVPAGNCRQMVQTFTHTYSNPGTYLVTLSSGAHRTTATVIVSGSTSQPPSSITPDSVTGAPGSGAAPLTVQFKGVINGSRSCDGGTYTLEFGDGQSSSLPYPADGCQSYAFSISHQYTETGVFTARLYKPGGALASSVSITVNAGSSQIDSLLASPSNGSAPLSVAFSGVINGSKACDGTGVYTLVFGDGQSTQLQYNAGACQAFSYNVSHQYAQGGTFTARLFRGTETGTLAGSATISVTGSSSSGTYSIVSVTPAVGGNIYTTSVNISYPTCGGYSFSWGDGSSPKTVAAAGTCTSTSNTTLTHTYSTGGSYTVILRDGNGALKSTASVVISM